MKDKKYKPHRKVTISLEITCEVCNEKVTLLAADHELLYCPKCKTDYYIDESKIERVPKLY